MLASGTTVHVHPIDDLISHDLLSDSCVCGPASIPVFGPNGSCGWVVVHASLDGREVEHAG